MHAQTVIVALIVLACALHATWRLMPAALRRGLAARLLHRDLPPAAGCGSGCDGCGGSAQAAVPAVQPITVHRRRPH